MADITGVLLAAGASARFEGNKLLAQIDSSPLVAYSAAALQACNNIIAVVREQDDVLQVELELLGIQYIVNPDPGRGMGYSIACGVMASKQSEGWCILPADMPLVEVETTRQLVQTIQSGARLAAPFYEGRRGHPVAFGQQMYHELSKLDGDIGARSILDRHANELSRIETQDAGVLVDIDTIGDFHALFHRFGDQLSQLGK